MTGRVNIRELILGILLEINKEWIPQLFCGDIQ